MTPRLRPFLIPLLLAAGPLAAEPGLTLSGGAAFGVTFDDSASRKTDGYGLLDIDPVARIELDNGLILGAQTRIRAENRQSAEAAAPRFFITTGRLRDLPRR